MRMKLIYSLCFGIGLVMISSVSFSSEKLITMSLDQTKFADAVIFVSKQTGMAVKYDDSWADREVSGEFQNVSLDMVFHRILKGENIIVTSNGANDQVTIEYFGGKSKKMVVTNWSGGKVEDSAIDPVTGKTMFELAEISKLQGQRRLERLGNPDSIDPMTGKTRREIDEILMSQKDNYEKRHSDPGSIDSFTGMTYVELDQIGMVQQENYDDRMADPNSIDPFTGKTRGELNKVLQIQSENYEKRMSDPNAIDPMTGKTMSEINSILKTQQENREKRLGF